MMPAAGDVFSSQGILDPALAVGLYFNGNPPLGRMLFQALSGHVGMGDPGGAGGDGQHLVPFGSFFRVPSRLFCRLSCPRFFREFLLFRFPDQVIQAVHTVHGHDPVDEVRIHEQGGQPTEHVQMHIVLGIRSGNHEKQFGRLAV